MSNWKGAWFLAKHEMKRDRWRTLFSIGFVAYLLLFTAPLYNQRIEGEDSPWIGWATDFIFMSLLPLLGFVFNKTMMSYLKLDSYSRKLAQWRTLPISPKQIAVGRLIQMTITLFALQLLFFTLQYVIIRMTGTELAGAHFAVYALCWFCYSLVIAVIYAYWETGHSGKMYFLYSCVYLAVLLGLSIGLTLLQAGNIVMTTLRLIENGEWWIVFPSAAVGALALFVGANRIEKRLTERNYMN